MGRYKVMCDNDDVSTYFDLFLLRSARAAQQKLLNAREMKNDVIDESKKQELSKIFQSILCD